MVRESEGETNLVNILGIGRGFCHSGKYDFHSTSRDITDAFGSSSRYISCCYSCLRFAECGIAVPDGKDKSGRNTQEVLTINWSFRRGTACFCPLAQCG